MPTVEKVVAPLKVYRKRVPPRPNINLSLWSFMKNAIGKELTRIAMPVNVLFCFIMIFKRTYLSAVTEKTLSDACLTLSCIMLKMAKYALEIMRCSHCKDF